MKKLIPVLALCMILLCLTACGKKQLSDYANGTYLADVTMTGGTGKTTVVSPASVSVQDGKATATIVLSSSKYDYVIVNNEKILCSTTEPGSTFEIPVSGLDCDIPMIGDTVAMSTPHEIEYVLVFTNLRDSK